MKYEYKEEQTGETKEGEKQQLGRGIHPGHLKEGIRIIEL